VLPKLIDTQALIAFDRYRGTVSNWTGHLNSLGQFVAHGELFTQTSVSASIKVYPHAGAVPMIAGRRQPDVGLSKRKLNTSNIRPTARPADKLVGHLQEQIGDLYVTGRAIRPHITISVFRACPSSV
jgi:hypothetical protein